MEHCCCSLSYSCCRSSNLSSNSWYFIFHFSGFSPSSLSTSAGALGFFFSFGALDEVGLLSTLGALDWVSAAAASSRRKRCSSFSWALRRISCSAVAAFTACSISRSSGTRVPPSVFTTFTVVVFEVGVLTWAFLAFSSSRAFSRALFAASSSFSILRCFSSCFFSSSSSLMISTVCCGGVAELPKEDIRSLADSSSSAWTLWLSWSWATLAWSSLHSARAASSWLRSSSTWGSSK
mmetsp:Transcript_30850/g.98401  ORF Transcript_30850/g.98401 Transcript_30850/m.98401 type:complete len:236 (+) Transcript_30850:1168-1875(+)